jgi:membrane-associated protease RseP (regulator of RpoE activity)
MSSKAMYLAIALVIGAAVTVWYTGSPGIQPTPDASSATTTEPSAARITQLEAKVAAQINSMRDEINSLRDQLVSLPKPSTESAAPMPLSPSGVVGAPGSTGRSSDDLERDRIRALAQKGAIQALTESGFSLARAQEIERRIDAHYLAATEARYEIARRGESTELSNAEIQERFDMDSMLRWELGDADYARYLEAVGRPTEVMVFDVFARSAAEQAGMLAGDRIIGYDGHRVFGLQEITPLALEGDPGAPVVVDILRNGQPIQLVVPRGPLGIMGSVGSPIEVFPAERD